MIEIIFESHATSLDNEAELSSGWNDVELSDLGRVQAAELGKRRAGEHFDAIFVSDLQRSYKTAEIAFGNMYPIIKDERLRGCDYGELTKAPVADVKPQKPERIDKPFPGGESYRMTSKRMFAFLQDLIRDYNGKRVMIIGHRATQYGLEEHVIGKRLEDVVPAPWSWQPGWTYTFDGFETWNCMGSMWNFVESSVDNIKTEKITSK